MFWCCGKVDVVATGPPSDKLNVDVAIVAKPIVLVSRAPDLDNQIVAVKKDEVDEAEVEAEVEACLTEEEITNQTITALLGIALLFSLTYMAINAKPDQTFYIEPPRDL